MIRAGLHDVPAGHVAAVVTYLQMTAPAAATARPLPAGTTAMQERLANDTYRALFRAVGAPWLWFSRLIMDDATLRTILDHDAIEVWVIRRDGQAIGFVELDFRTAGACELAFFGIIKEATGQGLGGPMMALAQSRAFARDISRLHVHTCSLDDPRALDFYRKAGFTPYKRAVEVFADPRLDGPYPDTTASHIPCLF